MTQRRISLWVIVVLVVLSLRCLAPIEFLCLWYAGIAA